MTDPIADLLTRIRNSIQARHATCEVPASNEKENILKILKQEGFIQNFVRQQGERHDKIVIFLRYLGREQRAILNTIRRVSKPGRRIYKGYRDLKPVLGGLGVAILSTPGGVMSDKEAKSKKVGGEVLCEVW